MSVIAAGALGAAITSYLTAIWHDGTSPQLHRSVMAFLRSIVDAARPR